MAHLVHSSGGHLVRESGGHLVHSREKSFSGSGASERGSTSSYQTWALAIAAWKADSWTGSGTIPQHLVYNYGAIIPGRERLALQSWSTLFDTSEWNGITIDSASVNATLNEVANPGSTDVFFYPSASATPPAWATYLAAAYMNYPVATTGWYPQNLSATVTLDDYLHVMPTWSPFNDPSWAASSTLNNFQLQAVIRLRRI